MTTSPRVRLANKTVHPTCENMSILCKEYSELCSTADTLHTNTTKQINFLKQYQHNIKYYYSIICGSKGYITDASSREIHCFTIAKTGRCRDDQIELEDLTTPATAY
jgi:hypothetical protein